MRDVIRFFIDIGSVHRKLMPTYEERLTSSQGAGQGLRVHPLGAFIVGGPNCYELGALGMPAGGDAGPE